MTEFAHHKEQFKQSRWRDESNRKILLGKLIGAIGVTKVFPLGALVSIEDFNTLSKSQKRRLGDDPYYVAFQEYTQQMTLENALSYPPQPVLMTYAWLAKHVGDAEALWEAIREANPLKGTFMYSFRAADPRDHTPLQAADIWAYELGHHFQRTLPAGAEWRWPFKMIVKQAREQTGSGKFFTLCDRQFMLSRLREDID